MIFYFFLTALSVQSINVVCSSALEMYPVQCWQHVVFFFLSDTSAILDILKTYCF